MSESKKEQGKPANSAQMSENMVQQNPRTMSRGIGSSFAMAVDHLMNNAKNVKEEGKEFSNPNLGIVGHEEMKEFAKSHQPEGFNHKKKLSEDR